MKRERALRVASRAPCTDRRNECVITRGYVSYKNRGRAEPLRNYLDCPFPFGSSVVPKTVGGRVPGHYCVIVSERTLPRRWKGWLLRCQKEWAKRVALIIYQKFNVFQLGFFFSSPFLSTRRDRGEKKFPLYDLIVPSAACSFGEAEPFVN